MSEQEKASNIDDKKVLKEQKKLEKQKKKEEKKLAKAAKREEKKKARLAKKGDKSSSEKAPLGSKLIAILQLIFLVPLYGFVAVKSFMIRFSENAVEYVEDFIELLDLKDIALNENLYLVFGIIFTLLLLGVLVSSIFLLLNKKKLQVLTLIMSVVAILSAVVFTALMIAFEGDKRFLLALIPHFAWFAGVILYYSLKLAERPASFGEEDEEVDEEELDEDEEEEEYEEDEETDEDSADVAESVVKEEVVKKDVKKKQKVKKAKTKTKIKGKKKKVKDGRGYTVCLIITAIMHTFVLGILNLLAGLINVCASFSPDYDILFQNFIRTFEVKNIEITQLQLRTVFLVHVVVAILFIISGVGMFRKSSMLRTFTVYLVGTLAVFSGLSLLLQGFQAFNPYMAGYFVWFAFVLIYLNLRRLDIYFAPKVKANT